MSRILTNSIHPRSGSQISIGRASDTVSIAGTLTYEDVTNIDSVGVVTARGGLDVGVGGTVLTTTTAGYIGIGTEIPTALVEIRGDDFVKITRNSKELSLNANYSGLDEKAQIQVGTGMSLAFATNGDNERMRIDNSGRLLVGTTSDSKASTAVFQGNSSGSTDTGTVRIAIGTDAPTDGTNIGLLTFTDSSHSSTASLICQRDGGTWTSGSSQPSRLVLQTTADSASSPTERMRIDSSGNVLIGKTTTGLQVDGFEVSAVGGGRQVSITQSGNGVPAMFINSRFGAGTQSAVEFYFGTTHVGTISVTSTNTAYNTSGSDSRLKKNIEIWDEEVLPHFKSLQPKKFNFTSEDDGTEKTKGFIAQDNINSFPEAYPLTDNPETNESRYMYNPSGMVIYLMKALQEEIAKREELEQRLTDAGL